MDLTIEMSNFLLTRGVSGLISRSLKETWALRPNARNRPETMENCHGNR